ncbi:MAG: FAD-dependent oxidoreductase [Acidobacteriia bacterium]|nr:FAD-dependent oxidoreductase [Terriglobia bacterium]
MRDDRSTLGRRQLLRTLAGAAGIPLVGGAAQPLSTIGIIGAGMAGISLAWLLDGQRDVLLLESQPKIGGNVQSVAVNLDGQSFVVDVGAQYFNPGPYPTYSKLLSLLGLTAEEHSFTASITLFNPSESTPRFVSPILFQRLWPLLAPWNWAGIGAFATAFASAQQREEENASWDLTMEAWLQTLNLTEQQWAGMIVPWAASLYSASIEEAMGYSARAAMIFAAKALPANPLEPILYYVLNKGMAEVLNAMLAQTTTVRALTATAVAAVEQNPQGGFALRSTDGRTFHVDELVFACSGPAALSLLAGIPETGAQRAALSAIEFRPSRLALHTDPIYAPADPIEWSFFNAEIEDGYCEASMWLANVLAIPQPQTAAKLWKSWITHRRRQPNQVLYQAQFQHMVPTPATINAQTALNGLQGNGGIWFAGGYTRPYDSQETALLSAMEIAQGMSVNSSRLPALAGSMPF